MICPNCNADINDYEVYCPVCDIDLTEVNFFDSDTELVEQIAEV